MTYEQWLMALCLWREARGSDVFALTAIASVIRNRTLDPLRRWPRDIAEVILQPKQFSSFNTGDPNSVKFPHPVVKSPDSAAWDTCVKVATASLAADLTHGANCYESCAPDKLPTWAKPELQTLSIGPFRFYKL